MSTGLIITKQMFISSQTFPGDNVGNLGYLTGIKTIVAWMDHLDVKRVGWYFVFIFKLTQNFLQESIFEGIRRTNYTVIYHFHHGDTAVCHQFDLMTRSYKKTYIGIHALQFVCVIKAGRDNLDIDIQNL